MPLEDDSISKEADGEFNEEYCKCCCAEGCYLFPENPLTFSEKDGIFYLLIRLTEVEETTGSMRACRADRLGITAWIVGFFVFQNRK